MVSKTNYKNIICKFVEKIVIQLERFATILLPVSLAFSIVSIVKLREVSVNWNAIYIKPDTLLIQFSSLFRLMLFISPFLFLLLFAAPFIRLKIKRVQVLLIIFLITTWLLLLVQMPYTGYLYYYGRYLCSEMVPYSLILCGIFLSLMMGKTKWKKIALMTIRFTVIYLAIFSAFQIGHPETENPESLYQLDRMVGSDDVIIAHEDEIPFLWQITTPIKLYFDKQLFIISILSTYEEQVRNINYFYDNSAEFSDSKYGNIYLLEYELIDSSSEFFGNSLELVEKIDYSFSMLVNPYDNIEGPIRDKLRWTQILLPYWYANIYNSPIYLYRVTDRLN